MYEFFYSIGEAVINFFKNNTDISFKPGAFVDSLPLLGEGMLGIFIIMAVIFITVWILQKVTK